MSTQNIFSMVDTWNAAGTTFVGIGLNVTDTASAAGSLLMDLQVGGSSKFNVDKFGDVRGSNFRVSSLRLTQGFDYAFADNSGSIWRIGLSSSFTEGQIFSAGGNPAMSLTANVIEQRNGTNAQTQRWYETFTDASNYSRVSLSQSSIYFFLQTEAAGTGTKRGLILRGSGTNSASVALVASELFFGTSVTDYWTMSSSGHLLAGTDNTYDIGASNATRPRNVHIAGYVSIGDGITAPGAGTGQARIYVDTADGDLKVIFADGTIKTIATDT